MRFCLLFCIGWIAQVGFAQQIIPSDSTATIPFNVSGITNSVEESNIATESISSSLKSATSSHKLLLEFEDVYAGYEALRADTSTAQLEKYNLWALTDLKVKWDKYERDVDSERKGMNNLVEKYQEGYTKLSLLYQKWDITQASELANAPSTINDQIDSLQAKIDVERAWIEDSLAITLERYKVITTAHKDVVYIVDQIDEISSSKRLNVFSKDARPLFADWTLDHYYPNFFEQVWTSAALVYADVRDFANTRKREIEIHLILFILFLITFFYFQRAFNKSLPPDAQDDLTVKLINRPLALAITFGLFISFWYYSSPPPLIVQLLLLAILIPILYLSRILIQKRYWLGTIFISSAYLFDIMGEMMPSYPFTQRVIIFLLSIATAIFGVFLLYNWSKVNRTTTLKKWAFRMVVIYTLFSVLAVYANVVGSLSLARILTRTVVINGSVGVVLILGYGIFKSLMRSFVGSAVGQKLNMIQKNGEEIAKKTVFYLKLFFIYVFARSFFSNLYITDYVGELWDDFKSLGKNFGDAYLSVGQVVDFLLIIFVFTIIAGIFRAIIEVEILPRTKVKKGIPMAAGMLTRYTILVLGFLMAVAAAGISLDKVGFIIGAFGVGIGFGLQKVVGNYVSGLILVLERPVRVGDIVTASDTEGTITEIGIRASKIRDWDGAEVVIPNEDLITMKVTNWTFSDADRRRELFIRTAPDADPNQVIALCKEVIVAHENVIRYINPMVLFLGFKDFYLEFRVLFWVSENMLQTTSEVNIQIWEALHKNGIQTPVPKQEWLEKRQMESTNIDEKNEKSSEGQKDLNDD